MESVDNSFLYNNYHVSLDMRPWGALTVTRPIKNQSYPHMQGGPFVRGSPISKKYFK